MNIVKLKDILMPDTSNMAEFFNKNLKGKYAYWIKMRYIFPLESLDYKTYIQYEQLEHIKFLGNDVLPHIDLYSEECCMYDFAQVYIDAEITERINSINSYSISNSYITDYDIDITKIRRFRTWLAEELIKLNTTADGKPNIDENILHMLNYYKNNMYNEMIKYLNVFGLENAFSITLPSTGCNCCNSNISMLNLNTGNILSCNAANIYTKNLHDLMVKTFENVDFWKQYNKEFIITFKKYIDNIINAGFVIDRTPDNILYTVCNCNSNSNKNTESTVILKNLSEALEYIINDEITNHINFISTALYEWAEKLYDKMSWELK